MSVKTGVRKNTTTKNSCVKNPDIEDKRNGVEILKLGKRHVILIYDGRGKPFLTSVNSYAKPSDAIRAVRRLEKE
jgi:hypothetical protein